jgi:hypothetical protein
MRAFVRQLTDMSPTVLEDNFLNKKNRPKMNGFSLVAGAVPVSPLTELEPASVSCRI